MIKEATRITSSTLSDDMQMIQTMLSSSWVDSREQILCPNLLQILVLEPK
jgi:hypothetical protein